MIQGHLRMRQGFRRSRASDEKTAHLTILGSLSHFTTRIHLLAKAHGFPMRTEITPGQTSGHPGFDLVMAENLPEPAVLLAD